MGKCPLCGSDGDSLVFSFRCSNWCCTNFVSEGDAEILRPGEIFRFGEPKFLGSFPVRQDVPFRIEDMSEFWEGGVVDGQTEKPLESVEFKVDENPCPLFRIVSFERKPFTKQIVGFRICSMPFKYGKEKA